VRSPFIDVPPQTQEELVKLIEVERLKQLHDSAEKLK
jgi:hypothetical protein